jgi:hypothetical protein
MTTVDTIFYLAAFIAIVYYFINWKQRSLQLLSLVKPKSRTHTYTHTHSADDNFEDITQFARLETEDGKLVPLTDPLTAGMSSSLIDDPDSKRPQKTIPCPPDNQPKVGYYNMEDNDGYSEFNTTKRQWASGPQSNRVPVSILQKLTDTRNQYLYSAKNKLIDIIENTNNMELLARILFNGQYNSAQILDIKKSIMTTAAASNVDDEQQRVYKTYYGLADPDNTLDDQIIGKFTTELSGLKKLLAASPNNSSLKKQVDDLETRLEGIPILYHIRNIKENTRQLIDDAQAVYGLGGGVDNSNSYLTRDIPLPGRPARINDRYPRNPQLINRESLRRFIRDREADSQVLTKEEMDKKYAWVDLIGKYSLPDIDDPFLRSLGNEKAKQANLRTVMDILSDYDVNNFNCQRIYQECSSRISDGFSLRPYDYNTYDAYLDKLPSASEYVKNAHETRETIAKPEEITPDMAMDPDEGIFAKLRASQTAVDGFDMLD